MKKFVCKNCGVVNEAADEDLKSNDDWLECALPTGFEWTLPAGKIIPVIGDMIYISAQGEYLSRSAYLDKYNIDPELALKLMRLKIGTQTVYKILNNQYIKMASSGSKSGIINSWMTMMGNLLI